MTKVWDWLKKVRYLKPVRTAAQTALGILGVGMTSIYDINAQLVIGAAALAGLIAILQALADGTGFYTFPDEAE